MIASVQMVKIISKKPLPSDGRYYLFACRFLFSVKTPDLDQARFSLNTVDRAILRANKNRFLLIAAAGLNPSQAQLIIRYREGKERGQNLCGLYVSILVDQSASIDINQRNVTFSRGHHQSSRHNHRISD